MRGIGYADLLFETLARPSAFPRESPFNTPGTAEPSEYSPAELVVYEHESITTGRAGSMRKAPKRGRVGDLSLCLKIHVLRHAGVSLGSGCAI